MSSIIAVLTTTLWLSATPAQAYTNPAVIQSNISATICRPGWAKSARPPVSYTERIKLGLLRKLGLQGKASLYELDHVTAIELGGAPYDMRNLQLQPWHAPDGNDAMHKDRLEDRLHKLVCSGKLSLDDAQRAIATDWVAAYRRFM